MVRCDAISLRPARRRNLKLVIFLLHWGTVICYKLDIVEDCICTRPSRRVFSSPGNAGDGFCKHSQSQIVVRNQRRFLIFPVVWKTFSDFVSVFQ
jgi:hypothetical protein